MFHWIPVAFVRIVLFFIGGIVLAIHAPDFLPPHVVGMIALFLIIVYFVIVLTNRSRRRIVLNPGFTGLMVIYLCGYLNAVFHNGIRRPSHFSKNETFTSYYAVAISQAEEKNKSWKQVFRVKAVYTGSDPAYATGKVLIYFAKNDLEKPFAWGDELLFRGRPDTIRGPANPGEFDYRKFLSWKNIYHQQFVRKRDFAYVGYNPPNRLMALAISIRVWASDVLDSFIIGESERGIAHALVLGVTDGLDRELTSAYAATGAMHVLAVSGLHVGIIYLITGFLLKPVKSLPSGKVIFAGLSILILWGYACVTGLSPSVLRAVTMFTFVAIAQTLRYRTNVFNTLAASAFCLLLVNPFLLMSVGFQLSYLAVAGIVYLHPLMYGLFEPRSRVVDEIWKLSCVSLSAQLSTFSLGIFYFHQFPNYFLVSNLFVIPLAFVVLVGGLLLLATSWIALVAKGIGFLLANVIQLLNMLIFKLGALPFSVAEDLVISPLQCWMLMASVIFFTLFFQRRRIAYFYSTVFVLVCFSADDWRQYFEYAGRSRLIVYSIAGSAAFDIVHGGKIFNYADSLLNTDPDRGKFHTDPARMGSGASLAGSIGIYRNSRVFQGGELIVLRGRTILHLDSPVAVHEPVRVDYLILSGGVAGNESVVFEKINAREIILDSSYSYFVANKVLHSLPEQIQIHAVAVHGAFEANF